MKKVGVLTMYHQSINYGGLLQAYALCHFINSLDGFCAEQISYSSSSQRINAKRINKLKNISVADLIQKCFSLVENKTNRIITRVLISKKLNIRAASIADFRNSIPYSKQIYSKENISDREYDIIVAGSDRIWNPENVTSPYFLDFVKGKKKISYAASLTTNTFTKSQISFLQKTLHDFYAISVREKDSAKILSSITEKNVKWVCDPVLLLDRSQWDRVCTKRKENDDYIFCYFLGKDSINRKLVAQFAKKNNLKIVTIPFANNQFCKSDIYFGDNQLFELSPQDFLSYIKHAKYVFTDSFHATMFSIIFNKQFFALARNEMKGSGSRIESITTFLEIENHFCSTKEQLSSSYLLNLTDIDYANVNNTIEKFRDESRDYLKNILSDNKQCESGNMFNEKRE